MRVCMRVKTPVSFHGKLSRTRTHTHTHPAHRLPNSPNHESTRSNSRLIAPYGRGKWMRALIYSYPNLIGVQEISNILWLETGQWVECTVAMNLYSLQISTNQILRKLDRITNTTKQNPYNYFFYRNWFPTFSKEEFPAHAVWPTSVHRMTRWTTSPGITEGYNIELVLFLRGFCVIFVCG